MKFKSNHGPICSFCLDENQSPVTLCYCIPDFHELTIDTLLDASDLINQVCAVLDKDSRGSGRDYNTPEQDKKASKFSL